MVSYQVLSWRGIPSAVKVGDEAGVVVRKQLPVFFQQEIDRIAMAEGLIDSDAYLEEWTWSRAAERDGGAEEVAAALVEELAEEWRRENRPVSG
ncbi:MAG: virulence factor [Chloroflexota bacterium]|nr:virulence factor [Chloroflexota bacterium]